MKQDLVKCYLVKLADLRLISPKAYVAVCYSGKEAVIPRSQVFGVDEAEKSLHCWIAAWVVEKHKLQHSPKRFGWYDRERPKTEIKHKGRAFRRVERHVPAKLEPESVEVDDSLLR